MATDYKNKLNLQRTDFPMKADLVQREQQRANTLIFNARSSNASARLAIGKIPTSRSTKNTRPMSCACSQTSLKKALFIAGKSRFTGASRAEPRLLKRKLNTTTTSARAS